MLGAAQTLAVRGTVPAAEALFAGRRKFTIFPDMLEYLLPLQIVSVILQ